MNEFGSHNLLTNAGPLIVCIIDLGTFLDIIHAKVYPITRDSNPSCEMPSHVWDDLCFQNFCEKGVLST